MAKRRYPIGIQTFERIIEGNYYYVDKTELYYKLVKENDFVFLSRPRRFGKSLMVTTLKSYFEGRKDLFKGLKVEKLEQEWKQYPVIHLDMSGMWNQDDMRHSNLNRKLEVLEERFGITIDQQEARNYGERFDKIIRTAHEQAGEKVVLLIDEYDAPLQDNLNDAEALDKVRGILLNMYGMIKEHSGIIRFALITGITKFAQMSIFSKLNNIRDISMLPQYETLCGITNDEMLEYFGDGVKALAEANGETCEQAVEHIRRMYDGYHFSKKMTDLYNPFSLIQVLSDTEYKAYWFASGTPTMLIKMMQHFDFVITELDNVEVGTEQFDTPMEKLDDVIPLLYQAGYLTIKGYKAEYDLYTLGIPNEEVRAGLAKSFYRYYMPQGFGVRNTLFAAYRDFDQGGPLEDFLRAIQSFYGTILYNLDNKNERHYQALFYAGMKSFGAKVDAEKCTANGRIDIVLYMKNAIYVMEFKYQKSAQDALDQIIRKDYKAMFADDPRPVTLIGLNVSADSRAIDSWEFLEQ